MDAAKIQLSPDEAALVIRSDWILTKNRILQKVKHLLETIQNKQSNYLLDRSFLPTEVLVTGAKISKGENYKGLPWLILDQPRFFNKEQIFAIRTMFWWGHFFSTTLHLSGKYKLLKEEKIISVFDTLSKQGFHVCINADQWEHHFEEGNFIPMDTLTPDRFEEIIKTHPFIKLSKKITLTQWNSVDETVMQTFTQLIAIAGD